MMRLLITKKNGDKTIVNVQAFEQLPDERPRVLRVATSLPPKTAEDIKGWCLGKGVTMRWYANEQVERYFGRGNPLVTFPTPGGPMMQVSYPVEPWMMVSLKEEAKERKMTVAGLFREILSGKFE